MNILIIIPTRPEDIWIATQTAELHKSRAKCDKSIDIEVKLIIDHEKEGWIKCINETIKNNPNFTHYLYSCADYIPGFCYLGTALENAKQGWKLIGFNDGKWRGHIATVGLIEREWMLRNYEGNLLNPIYKKHFADTELTLIARWKKVYDYIPNAVLFEVDYNKEKKIIDVDDKYTFLKRRDMKFGVNMCDEFIKSWKGIWI